MIAAAGPQYFTDLICTSVERFPITLNRHCEFSISLVVRLVGSNGRATPGPFVGRAGAGVARTEVEEGSWGADRIRLNAGPSGRAPIAAAWRDCPPCPAPARRDASSRLAGPAAFVG